MSGIQQMLLAGGAGVVAPFTAWNVSGDNSPGNLATATFGLLADGTVSGLGAINDNTSPGSSNWYSPTSTGVGSSYWVRYTATSGTLSSNDASTWTQLNATRSVTKSASSGSASCTFTIEIAADSGGATVLLTSTGNVVGYTHT